MYSLYIPGRWWRMYTILCPHHWAREGSNRVQFFFFFTLIAGPFYLQCVLVTTKMKRRERFFVFFLWSSFDVNMTIKTQWHIENGGGWGLGGLKRRRNKSKKETTKEIVFHGLAGWRPTQSAWKNICPFKAFTNSYIYAWTLHFGLLMVSWSWKYI